MSWPKNIISGTPAKYLFKLESGDTSIICDPEPLEWASGSLEINRDLEAGGVFSSFQVDSLTFLGNGAKLLKQLFTDFELNAQATLIIYWWKSSTRSYIEFPTRFDVNFNFYEVVKVGKFAIGVKIKAVNNSTQTKFDNRKDLDIDICKLISIGGAIIKDWPYLAKYLNFPPTNAVIFAEWQRFSEDEVQQNPAGTSFTSIPLNVQQGDFAASEIQQVNYISLTQNINDITPFFSNALNDYVVDLYYKVQIYVDSAIDVNGYVVVLLNGVEFHYSAAFGSLTHNFLTFEDTFTDILIKKGSSIRFYVMSTGMSDAYASIIEGATSITQKISSIPARFTEGFPIYEAFERTLQHILDLQYPLYSEFFGRTAMTFNEKGEVYQSEDQTRFAHIQTGLNQRGSLLNDPNNPIAIKFKDLFKTAQSIWNVGYYLEKDAEGFTRIRIEEYSWFFKDVLAIDLSGVINKYDIESSVMPELVPIEIKSGFNNAEYLESNGRAEPNTTASRTTIINTNAKFDIVCPYRGDTKGILSNLSTQIDSKDTRTDSSIFIVKTQRLSNDWIPETGENITILSGSVFGNGLLNRYFTPARILMRHGNRIKSGLRKFEGSSLRFQKSDKLQTLVTSGEGYSIAENADILVSDLAEPLYKPIQHKVICKFTKSNLETLLENPLGYVKFSSEISGYLLNLKMKNNEDQAEILIIEKI